MPVGCPYGSHRSVEPAGSLPQPAWRLNNDPAIWDNEILVDVETLNVDSASFTQISDACGGDSGRIARRVREIVDARGKLHNPVTGSGGMLLGRVAAVGSALAPNGLGAAGLAPNGPVATDAAPRLGQEIATLVSLSLTPLRIDEIVAVHPDRHQIDVRGQAVLFETGLWAKMPADIPRALALAVLDVCGAPAQTAHLVKPGDTVLVLGGGGKSGLLCLHEARRRAGVIGRVIAFEHSDEGCRLIQALQLADVVIQGDARDALAVERAVRRATAGRLADVTINVVNVPGTELATILATRRSGIAYFFSMATSFTAAALGAEGVGSPVDMRIGNGYTPGHAQLALEILRQNRDLRAYFEEVYA